MKVKVNDNIVVTAGKDKGKSGKVVETLSKNSQVRVEGINFLTHFQKKSEGQAGGLIKKEAALPVSNVAVVCPECQKATRVGYQIVDGKKLRLCKKCHKTFV